MKDARISNKQTSPSVIVDLRIPGTWSHPGDLIKRLPDSCRVTPRELVLPDGARIDLGFFPPDKQFPQVFRSSCRHPPTEKELAIVDGYALMATLSSVGGSMKAARTIMKAAAILVRAGGAGVFIDNSMLAHGGELWLEMAEDGGMDALSYAFADIVQTNGEIWTVGMHVLGLCDMVLQGADLEKDYDIVELIRSMVQESRPIGNGHILAGVKGRRFSCCAADCDPITLSLPMRNPFGRVRLTKLRHAASKNQEPALVIH
ncbi:MAG: hypothetical protein JXA73_26220 [Acidobacteria bacterium]|nr:hypothetical protein [Acidobacteriota bacterium]